MTAVLYQIYPRSFADSDGDGSGDLVGIIEHLDHLEWLGVDGIWLSPVTVSPIADWGYDVADFCAVQPDLGTLEELDLLVAEARERSIRVLLDLVPNHTSAEHPWFVESRTSLGSPRREWYVWADPGPDDSPPNNWVSSSGARPGPSIRPPASTTCTTTWRSSRTSTGGTRRSAPPSTRSSPSGWRGGSPHWPEGIAPRPVTRGGGTWNVQLTVVNELSALVRAS